MKFKLTEKGVPFNPGNPKHLGGLVKTIRKMTKKIKEPPTLVIPKKLFKKIKKTSKSILDKNL